MYFKSACLFLLILVTACAAPPAQIVVPSRTPDPIQAYVDANSSQGTAVAAIATADYFSNQLTATVEARNQTATQQIANLQSTQQTIQILSTERAWNATDAANSVQSTSIALGTASAVAQQVIWTQRAIDIPANRPGFAIIDRFGPMQSYFVHKSLLISSGNFSSEALSELEQNLFARAIESSQGNLSLNRIAEWGDISQRQARKLQETWALRGWLSKDASNGNAFSLTAKAKYLCTNGQTVQSRTNHPFSVQTN